MLHMISARCVERDLNTIVPEPLEHTCWRRFVPFSAIIIIINFIIIIIILSTLTVADLGSILTCPMGLVLG